MPRKTTAEPTEFETIREMVNGMKDVWEGVVKGTWRQFGAMQAANWPRKLGYANFEEFAQTEFGGVLMIPRQERQEAVAELTAPVEDGGFGLSNAKAAQVLGVDKETVRRDRSGANAPSPDSGVAENDAFAPSAAPVVIDPTDRLSPVERKLWNRLEQAEIVVLNMRTHNALIDLAAGRGRYVRIDRRTDWGNPFEMPDDGDRATVVFNYEHHYLPYKPSLQQRREELKGKALGCWCAPEACHGDVLKQFAEGDHNDA